MIPSEHARLLLLALKRQIAKAPHLLVVRVDDALDLRRREHVLPLLCPALAEKPFSFFGTFLKAGLFFLLAQPLERRAIYGASASSLSLGVNNRCRAKAPKVFCGSASISS